MGADNQAERVISKLEFRDRLAEIFQRAMLESNGLYNFTWADASEEYRAGVRAGITAVLAEIDRRMADEQARIADRIGAGTPKA